MLTQPAVNKDYYVQDTPTEPAPNHSPGDASTNVYLTLTWIDNTVYNDKGFLNEEYSINYDSASYNSWSDRIFEFKLPEHATNEILTAATSETATFDDTKSSLTIKIINA